MRSITLHPQGTELKLTGQQLERLRDWVATAVEDAIAARARQDELQTDLLRMYEAVAKNPAQYADYLEGYQAVEVPLGAIATDSIYAQFLDLIFTVSPLITCRAQDARYVPHAKAMQRFANFLADEIKLREAAEHTLLDVPQLGTGFYYIPFREEATKTSGYQVVERGPIVISVPPEDVIVFGGAYQDINNQPLFGIRFWFTEEEMKAHEKFRRWDISKAMPAPAKDVIRSRREVFAASSASEHASVVKRYETFELYVQFDADSDGFAEDMLINYDRTSQSICRVRYKPYESTPAKAARYQVRAHMFYGMGVMEMLRSLQEQLTMLHNHQNINVILANTRMWAVQRGAFMSGSINAFPGRAIPMADPNNDIKELRLSDVYASLPNLQALITGLAERRVGINDVNLPRPSQVIGSRTPGITTMSMLQQVNKRFTPAFDSVRMATSGCVEEAIMRYSEKIRDGDGQVLEYLNELLGEQDASLVAEILSKPNFLQRVAVQLTASSASVNREADRQNAVMLVNLLGQYYDKALQLVQIASDPMTSEPVREVAKRIAVAAGEVIERTIRTFDQVRDPQTFVVQIDDAIDAAGEQATNEQMLGLYTQIVNGGVGSLTGGGGSAPPAGGPP